MDTDSAYFAIAGPTLESVIKPELLDKFYEERHKWLTSDYCEAHAKEFRAAEQSQLTWTRAKEGAEDFCTDCFNTHMYTKRTPGLFKLEWRGKGMVALCSKTYYGFGGEEDKVSTKGLQKYRNDLNPHVFIAVLEHKKAGSGENRGFRAVNNTMFTYTQMRDALSYFYPKRKVCADNFSTLPLDI